jgi:F-type H+-transporting ATPase subunit epsilon
MAAVLPKKLQLEIVSPERLLLSEEVDSVTLPGSEGYLGILPGHLPLLTTLKPGVITYETGGKKRMLAVHGGFLEVLPERVIVMADKIQKPEEINLQEARAAKERAEKKLASKEAIDVDAAMAELLHAVSQIQVAESAQR